jgi:lathosterol oxidase
MGLFAAVQIWTIYIHDSDMISDQWLERFLNTPAHHTLHHMHFTVNYGQYFTWCDTFFDSHRAPRPELDPIHAALKSMNARQLLNKADNCNHKRRKTKS